MASPVLYKMLCGGRERTTRHITLEDVDGRVLEAVLDLWCGKETYEGLDGVMTMASVADRLQIVEVVAALEDAIMGELSVGNCAELLIGSRRLGLRQVEAAAWQMAVDRFETVSRTAGFIDVDEETVGTLLDEDGLGVRNEEEAFEGLVWWMRGGEGGRVVGRDLLAKIRFGAMERDYFESTVRELLVLSAWARILSCLDFFRRAVDSDILRVTLPVTLDRRRGWVEGGGVGAGLMPAVMG